MNHWIPLLFFGKSDPFILGLMDFPWENEGCFVETALKNRGLACPFFWAESFKRHLFQRFKIVAIHLVFVMFTGVKRVLLWTQAM